MNPLISIILPTYNGARTINRAIASVLSQIYTHWELIIVNDGSTDETAVIVETFAEKDPRIIFLTNEKNVGIQKTLNRGLAVSKGKYIARIDDDDEWIDTSKLVAQVAFFESNPRCVLVGTDSFVVDERGVILSVNRLPKSDTEIRAAMLSKNCFLHSTILARKSIVEKVGGYSEEPRTRHVEDYDLWLRLGMEGCMANLGMLSTVLIASGDSLTSKNRVTQARHALCMLFRYRKQYPRFLLGFFVSITRFVFFSLLAVIPIPRSLWYSIQRIYRSI